MDPATNRLTEVYNFNYRPYMSEGVKNAIHLACRTGQKVTIDSWNSTTGKIVQYVTMLPEAGDDKLHMLFVVPEGSNEVKKFDWRSITVIKGEKVECQQPSETISEIKGLVARALAMPIKKVHTETLVNKLLQDEVKLEEILVTLNDACKTILQCRVISELIHLGRLDDAKGKFDVMFKSMSPHMCSLEWFDYCFAYLSLVKAGKITEELEKVDWCLGFTFAIRESQPEKLDHLLEVGLINKDDIKRIQALRADKAVKALFDKMNLKEHFTL
jgi:hypothetical protein